MLNLLSRRDIWQEFQEYKLSGGHLSKKDERALSEFIESRGYLPAVEKILRGEGFAPPKKTAISKMSSEKSGLSIPMGKTKIGYLNC